MTHEDREMWVRALHFNVYYLVDCRCPQLVQWRLYSFLYQADAPSLALFVWCFVLFD